MRKKLTGFIRHLIVYSREREKNSFLIVSTYIKTEANGDKLNEPFIRFFQLSSNMKNSQDIAQCKVTSWTNAPCRGTSVTQTTMTTLKRNNMRRLQLPTASTKSSRKTIRNHRAKRETMKRNEFDLFLLSNCQWLILDHC